MCLPADILEMRPDSGRTVEVLGSNRFVFRQDTRTIVRLYAASVTELPPAVRVAAAFRPYVCRWRRIAPAHEGPRNESNNKAHEPTNGRSTHYGSGHLIRVFRDIVHIFSSLYPPVLFLSRFAPVPGLVILRQTFARRSHGNKIAPAGDRRLVQRLVP